MIVKKAKNNTSSNSKKEIRPMLTPEARESQLVSFAMDLVEARLLDGTASSQETTHFLKIGSTKDRIEQEILEKKKILLDAQTDALKSAKRVEELYANALEAMKNYSSNNGDHDD